MADQEGSRPPGVHFCRIPCFDLAAIQNHGIRPEPSFDGRPRDDWKRAVVWRSIQAVSEGRPARWSLVSLHASAGELVYAGAMQSAAIIVWKAAGLRLCAFAG